MWRKSWTPKSLATVYPATWSSASARETPLQRLPITTAISPS